MSPRGLALSANAAPGRTMRFHISATATTANTISVPFVRVMGCAHVEAAAHTQGMSVGVPGHTHTQACVQCRRHEKKETHVCNAGDMRRKKHSAHR
jgi:hypothetical protein